MCEKKLFARQGFVTFMHMPILSYLISYLWYLVRCEPELACQARNYVLDAECCGWNRELISPSSMEEFLPRVISALL